VEPPAENEIGSLYRAFNTMLDRIEASQEELRRSEANLAEAQRIGQFGYWHWDVVTGDVTWSDEVYRIFGRDPTSFQPDIDTVLAMFPPEDSDFGQRLIEKIIRTREQGCLEQRICPADRPTAIIYATFEGRFDEDGSLLSILGVVQDITARKQIEEKLRLTQFAVDRAAPGIFWVNREGKFEYVNESACRELGYDREELLTMGVADVDADYSPDTRPERWRMYKAQCVRTFETHHRTKDGRIIPVEVTSNYLKYGDRELEVAFAVNISERKRAEEALRDASLRQKLAVQAGNIGLWDWDLTTNRVQFSAEWKRQIGYEENEIEDSFEEWKSRVHPDDLQGTLNQIQICRDSPGSTYQVEFRFRHRNGSYRWILAHGNVIADEDGRPVRMVGTHVDLTERKEAEEALHASQEALLARREREKELVQVELAKVQSQLVRKTRLATLGQLTATVSHEIRNPLGSIRTAVYSIGQGVRGHEPSVDRALERAERNIVRCDRIIEELLDYTRTSPPHPAPTKIDFWVGEVLDEHEIPETVTVNRNLTSGVKMPIDRDQMRRCVVNILANALQSMAELPAGEAALTVDTAVDKGRLLIRIHDTGGGILPEDMEKIFEPLFTTKGFGVGLGLPLVEQVMEQFGGGVDIQSEPGKGTVATLWLPLPNEP
jgi:PAS domain S-box-containing protein